MFKPPISHAWKAGIGSRIDETFILMLHPNLTLQNTTSTEKIREMYLMVQLYFCTASPPVLYFPGPLHSNKIILPPQRLLILTKPRLMPLRISVSPPRPALRFYPSFHTSTSRPIIYILPNTGD